MKRRENWRQESPILQLKVILGAMSGELDNLEEGEENETLTSKQRSRSYARIKDQWDQVSEIIEGLERGDPPNEWVETIEDILERIWAKAQEIYTSETLDWEEKYDGIFSEEISRRVFKLTRMQYCDPDTSYEEDVRAFMTAFEGEMREYGLIKANEAGSIPVLPTNVK